MFRIHTARETVRTFSSRMRALCAMSLALTTALSTVSCNRESRYSPEGEGIGDGRTTMSLNLRLSSASPGGTGTDNFETGSDYENYIDLAGGDCRIYFFTNSVEDGNDTFLAEFTPSSTFGTNGLYTNYSMLGEVPEGLLGKSDFKVVVLANWGKDNYPKAENLTAETTIDKLCCTESPYSWGTFERKADFAPGEENLIPFYGVQEYTGKEFRPNHTLSLDTPVNMLRAMAKIEVKLNEEDSDMELAGVTLNHYNEKGYCAPKGIYKSEDYVSKSDPDGLLYNYEKMSVHLIDDANDENSSNNSLSLAYDENDGLWYAYVPEYRNMSYVKSSEGDYAYLQLDLGLGEAAPNAGKYRLYFNEDGATAGADRDILRNVIYRFTVTLKDHEVSVTVDSWEKSVNNDFEFNFDEDNDQGGGSSGGGSGGDGSGGETGGGGGGGEGSSGGSGV